MMEKTSLDVEQPVSILTVDHVADFCRRYPGETVTFHTRVSVCRPVSDLTLKVAVPAGMVQSDCQSPPGRDGTPVLIEPGDDDDCVIWKVTGELPANTRWEYQVQAQVVSRTQDTTLESLAVATATTADGASVSAQEFARVVVPAKGRYLSYLPALYQSDDLMGRFLMLFESYWSPLERQVDNLALYFDPQMIPADFLPWLASWFNLALDESLPEERRRQLIQSAVTLYRKRGTRQGLQDYLEIYTGGQVRIIEHRANDFRLGTGARLGPGIALGVGAQPYTFTVKLRLPSTPSSEQDDYQKLVRRRMVDALINAEKPAYTDYTLHIVESEHSVESEQSSDEAIDHKEG